MLTKASAIGCFGSPSKESWTLVDKVTSGNRSGTLQKGIYRFEAIIPGHPGHASTAAVVFDHPVGYIMYRQASTGTPGWPNITCDACPGILVDLNSQTYSGASLFFVANGAGIGTGSNVPNITTEADMDSASGVHAAIYKLN
ncbi:MAG: hypothetical protein LBL52_01795 [Rickettsiales bacterium]|jgi:hypothetical protein|nr:hypothetical protein [Rickettsiales bacterium]